jgi:lipoyl(octanoyl) transferase
MSIVVHHLGKVSYNETWQKMQDFTNSRNQNTADELWVLQHPPVYTMGKNAKSEHLLEPGNVPVINADRGGQVTYHGPGQLVVYTLLDLKRLNIGVRELVTLIEKTLVELLNGYGIEANARPEAPGVYANNAKIAALGLRIRKGCSFHGLALNVDMDLEPFSRINPCGYEGLEITQLKNFIADIEIDEVVVNLQQRLMRNILFHTSQ